jgi:hexosaminidase
VKIRSRAPMATLTICLVLGIVCPCMPQSTPGVIPQPAAIAIQDGRFQITGDTCVVAVGDAQQEASQLIDFLAPAAGFRLALLDQPPRDNNLVQLLLVSPPDNTLGDEGYQLQVTPQAIRIRANKPAGLFYAIQTLRQLLPPAVFSPQKSEQTLWAVPCVRITDSPRFGWRGLLIDPARHFIPVPDVKRFLDSMAIHKFNRLQIHLTDDCGWRIEIRKHPELAQIGSRMDFTEMRAATPAAANSRFGGFYSQDDIRDLVRYAARLYITLVPEIEMPAHTGAAIVSCPQLGLYPQKLAALPSDRRWKAHEWVLAPRPESVAFMSDVLAEVMELFPSPYIHIGGDEANIEHWKKSDQMQGLIRQLGIKDESELHSWFIRQLDAFLTQHGRRLVGWDEILQGGLAPGAVVMSWRGQEGGVTAAKAGHAVVMAPTSHTYFDFYQGPPASEPTAIGGDLPLEKVFQFEPVPPALNADQAKHILGGQGQLWGEFIPDAKHRDYMAWPRGAALAEILWSPKTGRNIEQFLPRLRDHLKRLDAAQVHYRPLR